MENITGDISFKCKHDRFLWKFKIPSFYYQNVSDTFLITAFLSFACSRQMQGPDTCEIEKYQSMKVLDKFREIIKGLQIYG